MTIHTCHAYECTAEVPPKMFMCPKHWASLRPATQAAILREYSQGQEITKTPTLRYCAVQQYAIGEAAFKANDVAAARVTTEYLAKAMQFRAVVMQGGDSDPLAGLLASEAEPLPKGQRCKILSIWGPWAQLFFIGGEDAKDVENRGWATSYRGPIAVHASKIGHPPREVARILAELVRERRITLAQSHWVAERVDQDRGHVIGTVRLTGCKRTSKSPWWVKGQVALEVAEPRLIERIPVVGKQGLRDFILPEKAAPGFGAEQLRLPTS